MEKLTISNLENKLFVLSMWKLTLDYSILHVEVLAPIRSDGVLACCRKIKKQKRKRLGYLGILRDHKS
jgi:hypothetical protein